MMKYVILALVVVVVMGRPQAPPASAPVQGMAAHPNVTIVSSTSENDGKGGYKWAYETSDGSKAEQEGHTIPPGAGSTDSIQVIKGSYSYMGSDGKTYTLEYTADQNGFQPKADFLPMAPANPNAPAPAGGAAAPQPPQQNVAAPPHTAPASA